MSPSKEGGHGESTFHEAGQSENDRSKRFRFKRKHHGSTHSKNEDDRRHRHKHHRSKRRKRSPQSNDDPSNYDDSVSGLLPDVAFRESLFDAMADDEGAAFWEGVYGQPIHSYSTAYLDEQKGELEQMDDEEYAQYVRRKMWEKSWEGIEAAKEEKRREQARNQHQEQEQRKRRTRREKDARARSNSPQHEPDYIFNLEVEQSLRRGARRKNQKKWSTLWGDYLRRWEELQTSRELRSTSADTDTRTLGDQIAWPVQSGKRSDVNPEEVEHFIRSCAESFDDDESAFVATLKSERIRWHPDKIQQRYGFMGVDELTMQGVTAVFQTLDHMWQSKYKKP